MVVLMLELLKFGNNAMEIIETLAMLYTFRKQVRT